MFKQLKYIIFSLLLSICLNAISQEKYINIADEQVKDLQFQLAITNYSKALKKMKQENIKKRRIQQKIADAYRLINNPEEAAGFYELIADTKLAEKKPIVYVNYAEVLRELGKYELAKSYYQKYLSKFPDNKLALN